MRTFISSIAVFAFVAIVSAETRWSEINRQRDGMGNLNGDATKTKFSSDLQELMSQIAEVETFIKAANRPIQINDDVVQVLPATEEQKMMARNGQGYVDQIYIYGQEISDPHPSPVVQQCIQKAVESLSETPAGLLECPDIPSHVDNIPGMIQLIACKTNTIKSTLQRAVETLELEPALYRWKLEADDISRKIISALNCLTESIDDQTLHSQLENIMRSLKEFNMKSSGFIQKIGSDNRFTSTRMYTKASSRVCVFKNLETGMYLTAGAFNGRDGKRNVHVTADLCEAGKWILMRKPEQCGDKCYMLKNVEYNNEYLQVDNASDRSMEKQRLVYTSTEGTEDEKIWYLSPTTRAGFFTVSSVAYSEPLYVDTTKSADSVFTRRTDVHQVRKPFMVWRMECDSSKY